MSAITLPTPEVTTPFSWYADEKGRTRRITYFLSPKPEGGQGKADAVRISVSHDKSRKRFTATAWRCTIGSDNGFTTESFSLMDGVCLKTQPVARFSAKAIEAFTEQVLAEVPLYLEASEKFAAMFAYETEE